MGFFFMIPTREMTKKRKVQPRKTAETRVSPRGRKSRDFDKNIFEGLCNIWCTITEIESIFSAERRTIELWCQREYGQCLADVYNRYSDGGKASLRRNQLMLSKRSAAMAIWLGKQKLGQKEVQVDDIDRLTLDKIIGLMNKGLVKQTEDENVDYSNVQEETRLISLQ